LKPEKNIGRQATETASITGKSNVKTPFNTGTPPGTKIAAIPSSRARRDASFTSKTAPSIKAIKPPIKYKTAILSYYNFIFSP